MDAKVLETLLRKSPRARIAVVGASNNPEKYGNTIVRNLAGKGYDVVPVNPKESTVAGIPAVHTLAEVDPKPEITVMVVPPPVTLREMKEAARLGLPAVWLQDGSFDDAVLAYAATAPFRTVHHACVMVMSRSTA